MNSFAVSFDLESNATYAGRYRSLMEQIGTCWNETTSFALVETIETLSAFADRLYYQTQVNSSTDILLVIDHSVSHAIARGPIKYPNTLGSHFLKFEKK